MPQSETADQSAASAAPQALAGRQRVARPSPAAASADDSAQSRCHASGGVNPLFLSACVDCGEPMRGDAAAGALIALTRNVTVASLLLLMPGACLVWILA
jgi:hypothetical protein